MNDGMNHLLKEYRLLGLGLYKTKNDNPAVLTLQGCYYHYNKKSHSDLLF